MSNIDRTRRGCWDFGDYSLLCEFLPVITSSYSHHETSENEDSDVENDSVSSKSSKSTQNTAGENPEDIEADEKNPVFTSNTKILI